VNPSRLCFVVFCAASAAAAPAASGEELLVLGTAGFWRHRLCLGTELARLDSGGLVPVHPDAYLERAYRTVDGKRQLYYELRKHGRSAFWPLPAKGWRQVDFDDASWARLRGPFCIGGGYKSERGRYRSAPLLCLRGKFVVRDPRSVGRLTLHAAFHGGLVVYVNGKEIARSHLPKGDIHPDTPADDYPKEAYVDDQGHLLNRRIPDKRFAGRYRLRRRQLQDVHVPAAVVRKGTNVLALEVHRAPAPEVFFTGRTRKSTHPPHVRKFSWWSRIGVESVRLTAPTGARILGSITGACGVENLQVWNRTVVKRVSVLDRPDPAEPLRTVRICGARNGVFSGQVVVGSTKAIKRLTATCRNLRSADSVMPASAVAVRYARPDGAPLTRDGPRTFNALASSPPDTVQVEKTSGRAVQAVWFAVRVPRDAAPGRYSGAVILRAEGRPPVRVPLELQIADWTLPEPKRFMTHMGLIQSPDSVAMHYDVEMWSERHWKLLERSFELIGQLGGKVLYLPLVARTHFGNAHSMVRWIQRGKDRYDHDFRIAEKYLDLAVRQLGRIPVVCLYCWEPQGAAGHYAHKKSLGDRKILFSVVDPGTGDVRVAEGPTWGTPECSAFWEPVMAGMRTRLKKRGLARSMMVGVSYDYNPSEGAVKNLTAAAPDAPWAIHSHVFWTELRGRTVGYLVTLWGMHGASDPELPALGGERRFHGWKLPRLITYFPRTQMLRKHPLARFRTYPELWIVAKGKYGTWPTGKRWSGTDGLARMGVDFWDVVRDRRGRNRGSLLGYYQPWGGFDMGRYGAKDLVAPGEDGAIPTVRFEMLRECLQENDARVFLEKALTDPTRRAAMGKDLARRAQEALDRRVRAVLATQRLGPRWFEGSGWQARSAQLYALVAEVAGKLNPTE
jgi:hypothetical protein